MVQKLQENKKNLITTLQMLNGIKIVKREKKRALIGPATCKRSNLGPCPRPWRGATTDHSTTQKLARFRALPDPGDEGHGVGRGG